MGNVRTVNGDIDAKQLGFTYTHEHLWCNPPNHQKDRDLELTNYEASLSELWRFKKIGGEAIVDATTLDYGRDGKKLKALSSATGVHVIGTSGFNKHIYFPAWVESLKIEEITEKLIRDVEVGMDGSTAKAGILKAGSWMQLIHPLEEKVTRAVARAQRETGAPIWLHTEAGTMGEEMLDILEEEGVDLTKVAVGHSDRNADPYYHLQLAKRGAYVQFDGVSKVKYYPDSVRVSLIKNLIDSGYSENLLISADMGRQSYLHAYGGGPGFEFIKAKFIPRLLNEGLSKDRIDLIFKENPARWLGQF
ncbi:phosphotriesterase [Anaerobacillus sp. 1_MG-2023]|uniref:phosphotriesterase family protein n=1 Tax=Anaerobacillus sp. 1_MG-2023 TaxID=3062655 RepID=UPI0026E3EDA9|nr:phosphotriesterase-related protein [Anaerobacillus sp. 1_MG-2023]MDO6657415.1 phosphotriesterase-related protein [Anaerobacillus sp. 1_MG-2023]